MSTIGDQPGPDYSSLTTHHSPPFAEATGGKPLSILFFFGTRPEAVKLAPVIREARARPEEFSTCVVVSAQHREMLDQVLSVFEITPDVDLDIMEHGQSLTDITCRSLRGLEAVLSERRPDLLVVQGDTTSMFAGALAAFYAKIPVAHVEAGLRTRDRFNPFPEEMNRRLTGSLADIHLAPTPWARDNLLREGVPPETIYVTGNPVTDALLWIIKQGTGNREQGTGEDSSFVPSTSSGQAIRHSSLVLTPLGETVARPMDEIWDGRPYVVAEVHRRENLPDISSTRSTLDAPRSTMVESPLAQICRALARIVESTEVGIIFSAHRNPVVREVVSSILGGREGVLLIEPPDYPTFVRLLAGSELIVTDSGGIQEEAPTLRKRVLVTRKTTERPEAVEAGVAAVVGVEEEPIFAEALRWLSLAPEQRMVAPTSNPFGDGRCAARICDAILHYFRRGNRPEDFQEESSTDFTDFTDEDS